eukprot:3043087-Amphidinium_carterae.1
MGIPKRQLRLSHQRVLKATGSSAIMGAFTPKELVGHPRGSSRAGVIYHSHSMQRRARTELRASRWSQLDSSAKSRRSDV